MAFFVPSSRFTRMLALLLITACAPKPTDPSPAIRAAMAEQERAWDNADIPAFMGYYSDTICFIGRGRRTCGREAVTANYIKAYPDKAAMGDLSFGIDEILAAGADHAWVTGSWKLYRATDTVGGGFSLLWNNEPDGWRIVRDHTY